MHASIAAMRSFMDENSVCGRVRVRGGGRAVVTVIMLRANSWDQG